MAIYDLNGSMLSAAYDIDGVLLDTAYDLDGNIIFSPTPSNVITVMSFNVGCFYSQYFPCPNNKTTAFYNRHQTIFGNSNPFLCGMQEWNSAIGTVPASTLMNSFFTDYEPSYVYVVQTAALTMASRCQLEDFELVRYADQSSGDNRYYQKAYVTIGDKRICFVNTHLGTSNIRNAQFVELLDMLEDEEYFIAFGDFNFRIEQAGDSEYNLSVKLALDRGFNSAQNANGIYMTGYHGETVESSTSITALDNVITSTNLPISNVRVDTTKLTDGLCQANSIIIDHLPIICDVTINEE